MSVAGWKCADCGGEGYHFNLCPAWLRPLPDPRDAEITALRAALDREREKAAEAAFLLTKSRVWGGMGWKWNPYVAKAHALLSERGEER